MIRASNSVCQTKHAAPGTQVQKMVWVYLRFPDYIFVGYEDGSGAGVGAKFHYKHYGTGEEAKAEAAERAMHYSAHRKYQHGDIVEYVEFDTNFA